MPFPFTALTSEFALMPISLVWELNVLSKRRPLLDTAQLKVLYFLSHVKGKGGGGIYVTVREKTSIWVWSISQFVLP